MYIVSILSGIKVISVQKALHKKVISVYIGQHNIRGEYDWLEGIILHKLLETYYFAHSMQAGSLGQGSKGRESLQSHLRNLNSASSAPSGSLSAELSDFGQTVQNGNECWM